MKQFNTADIVEILLRHPSTVRELMDYTGLSRSTVGYHLKRVKLSMPMYISGWRRTVGQMAPVYAIGRGKDMPRPKPLQIKPHKRTKREPLKGAWG